MHLPHPASRPTSTAASAALALLAAGLGLAPPPARADAPQVQAALLFLQAKCQLSDARLDARQPGDGRLHLSLRTPQFTRQTSLVHRDLPLFTEQSMKRNAELPPETGACLEPGVNAIINVLMELPQETPSLPMVAEAAPPPAGAYVPPMMAAPAPPAAQPAPPPPVSVVAAVPAAPTPAPASAGLPPSMAVVGEMTVSILRCGIDVMAGKHFCDLKVENRSRQDFQLVVQARQSTLYDAAGGAYVADEVRLGNQGGVDYRGFARVKIISDTTPSVRVGFHRVPESVRTVKRLDIWVGADLPEGLRMQKLTVSDIHVE